MQERGVIKKKRRVDVWKRAEEMRRWKESGDGRWRADKSTVVSVIVISSN